MNLAIKSLLTNEGELMQGCFKSSLGLLRALSTAERGPFYVAFFNFATGLERLLKLIVLLDHWHCHKKFPSNMELKGYGHNLEKLHATAKGLCEKYSVEKSDHGFDDLDLKLLKFFSDFGNGSRYYNLDTLVGTKEKVDPLRVWGELCLAIYQRDIPRSTQLSYEAEVNAALKMVEGHVVNIPSTGMSGELQDYAECCHEHGMMEIVLPEICWRLVRMLVPLQALLTTVRQRVHEEENGEDIPFMEEFLDFVCEDKKVILESDDWP